MCNRASNLQGWSWFHGRESLRSGCRGSKALTCDHTARMFVHGSGVGGAAGLLDPVVMHRRYESPRFSRRLLTLRGWTDSTANSWMILNGCIWHLSDTRHGHDYAIHRDPQQQTNAYDLEVAVVTSSWTDELVRAQTHRFPVSRSCRHDPSGAPIFRGPDSGPCRDRLCSHFRQGVPWQRHP